MSKSCPISSRRIDSNLVRFISAQVSIITVLLIYTKLPIFAFILLFDFTARSFKKPIFSPFLIMGKFWIHLFKLKVKLCDEAPKRFALFMGLAMTLCLSILYVGHFFVLAEIISSILLICALFETVFDFCVGCKIYQIIQKLKF